MSHPGTLVAQYTHSPAVRHGDVADRISGLRGADASGDYGLKVVCGLRHDLSSKKPLT
jgi:hypothetical protein